jgi:hypothetical protein
MNASLVEDSSQIADRIFTAFLQAAENSSGDSRHTHLNME